MGYLAGSVPLRVAGVVGVAVVAFVAFVVFVVIEPPREDIVCDVTREVEGVATLGSDFLIVGRVGDAIVVDLGVGDRVVGGGASGESVT